MKSLEALEKISMAEGEARGEARATARVQRNIALELLKLGQNALEDIAEACNMTLQQVQELAHLSSINPH